MSNNLMTRGRGHFMNNSRASSLVGPKTASTGTHSLIRFLTTVVLSGAGFLGVGCSSHLPYYISVDSQQKDPSPQPTQCVLPLDKVVKTVLHDHLAEDLLRKSPIAPDTVRAIQRRFELAIALAEFEMGVSPKRPELLNKEEDELLASRIQADLKGRQCVTSAAETKNGSLLPSLPSKVEMRQTGAKFIDTVSTLSKGIEQKMNVKVTSEPPAEFWLQQAGQKWMTTYSLDPADPDHSLERLEEFVRSSQLVKKLANQPLRADESAERTTKLFEHVGDDGSQWCGKPESSCKDHRSLYRVITVPDELYAKELPDLINNILLDTDPSRRQQHRIIMLGYQLPWDEDRTLIRYGVTFYFEDWLEPDTHMTKTQLLGYDLVYANEATPDPRDNQASSTQHDKQSGETSLWKTAKSAWYWSGYPFSVVIGAKNAAFELTKLPFSFVAGLIAGRDTWNFPLQTLLNTYDTLAVELSPPQRGAQASVYRFLTETPLVGQVFQYNFGADLSEPDQLKDEPRRKLFLSRGIYGGHKWGQDTGLWTAFAREAYPTYKVHSPPYRHGTAVDVAWSMFNLSHGPAYTEARYIMNNADPDDRIYLAGHSGGVQRSAAASRILWHHRYRVVKVLGIAGPSIGQAFVDLRYPEAFPVYLSSGAGANDDIVSKVGLVAGSFSTVLRNIILVPAKYIVGSFCITVTRCRDTVYKHADRIGYSNAHIVQVEEKPSSQHQTPLRLSLGNRLIFDAYLRSEFATAFREDLERPMWPHRTDRPAAFDWEQ